MSMTVYCEKCDLNWLGDIEDKCPKCDYPLALPKVSRFEHDPQGLLEDMAVKFRGEQLQSATVIVTDKEGRLMWDGASYRRADLLWAIRKFEHQILFGS